MCCTAADSPSRPRSRSTSPELHLGRRAFLGVKLAGSSEPRDVPFDDVVCDALERYVSDRRSRIRSDGSNALFLRDQGTRLPAEVARAVMKPVGPGDRDMLPRFSSVLCAGIRPA
jgi:hypothetical protein